MYNIIDYTNIQVYFHYFVYLLIRIVLVGVRVVLLKEMIGFSMRMYAKSVAMKILPISLLVFVIPFSILLSPMQPSLLRLAMTTGVGLVSTGLIILGIGLDSEERRFVFEKIKQLKWKIYICVCVYVHILPQFNKKEVGQA